MSQSSCNGKLIPRATVLTGGTLKEWLDCEGSSFMNVLMPFSKEWITWCMTEFSQKGEFGPLVLTLSPLSDLLPFCLLTRDNKPNLKALPDVDL